MILLQKSERNGDRARRKSRHLLHGKRRRVSVFTTGNELKRRIADLERERDALLREREIADNSGLAKCKGIMCRSCEHAVFISNICGSSRLLGCDNYKRIPHSAAKA